jgi:putative transposase
MKTYKRHRFPRDIISYAVWLYYRFNLDHRDIEDLLAERGITVSREALLQKVIAQPQWRTQKDRYR